LGNGEYAAKETIVDRDGNPVLSKPDQQQTFESFGSFVAPVDWDGDDDIDLLIGTFSGELRVRINEGTPRAPVFASENLIVHAGSQAAKLPGGHAAVSVADWDGDGLWDVVSGCEDGSVHWLRNAGTVGDPRFEAWQQLLPKHEGTGYDEELAADQAPKPGIRSQVFATDYDLDGKIDLLVGDFCTNVTLRSDLTAEDRVEMRRIRTELEASGRKLGALMEDLRSSFEKTYPGDLATSDEATKAWSKAYRALVDGEQYKAADAQRKEFQKQLNAYFVAPPQPGLFNPLATCHGYVWLYLRK
jgi:hypothetical protein